MALSTYYIIWQRDYPRLKVSPPSEDLCDLCTKYANRHKFLAKHKTLGSDVCNLTEFLELFGEEAIDDDDGEAGPKEKSEAEADQSEAEQPEDESQEEPQTEEQIQIEKYLKEVDNQSDPNASQGTGEQTAREEAQAAREKADHMREEMLLEAALHINMARRQRLLYNLLIAKARAHAQMRLPHHLRSYTFVVDYGQNMELPVFNRWQPG